MHKIYDNENFNILNGTKMEMAYHIKSFFEEVEENFQKNFLRQIIFKPVSGPEVNFTGNDIFVCSNISNRCHKSDFYFKAGPL